MGVPRVLAIANRGEIAIRIARTAQRLGWQPVVLLGDPDLDSYAAREIGVVEHIGPAGTELDPQRVVAAARRVGASALHPGYGFLSEKPELSRACQEAGIAFVGPSPETLERCGDKIATREAAQRAGVPVLPASTPLTIENDATWRRAAADVGYPLIAKVAAGGGGRGLRVARLSDEVESAIRSALREAGVSGAGTTLYLERYVEGARHVEVQVAGNGEDAVALGDRDCSIQRRHQKVIEEAPAFGLSDDLRERLHRYAVAITSEVRLSGVGTVEFLLSRDGELFFIEINPRLQVEHTVTEEVTGLDLVAVQLGLVDRPELPSVVPPRGHAIQARLYAEDPLHGFAPSPGPITVLDWTREPNLRIDAGYLAGDSVPSHYDPLIGKLIAWGTNRTAAIDRLAHALADLRVGGIATNRPWLLQVLSDDRFRSAHHTLATAETIDVVNIPPVQAVFPAVVAELSSNRSFESAWSSSGPFRIVGSARLVFHGDEAGGWQASVSTDRSIDGMVPVEVVVTGADESRTDHSDRAGGSERGIAVVQAADSFDVSAPAGRWLMTLGPKPSTRAAEADGGGAVQAPMPGTVVSVNVEPGQRVVTGEILVVMTAMKIEITLAAPFDGTVTSVNCKEGDLIGSKQALVTVSREGERGTGEVE